MRTLAKLLARKARPGERLVVALYCCSTASWVKSVFGGKAIGGDGGFADALRDCLCQAGVTSCAVFGHDTVGHATENPTVVDFEGAGSPTGGHGGSWIVAPGAPAWRAWRHALATTDLRLRFPFMSLGAIHAELGA